MSARQPDDAPQPPEPPGTHPKITTRILSSGEYPAWNSLVADSVHGSPYSTPEYLAILCGATGARFDIVGVFKREEMIGGVGLYQTDSPAGMVVSNRLLLYYNGLVLKDLDSRYPSLRTSRQLEVLTALEQYLGSARFARLRFHNRHPLHDLRPFLAKGWSVRPSYSYEVPLADLPAQFQRVEQNLRRLINRCGKAGVSVGEDDDFDSFYRLHHLTHTRKGAPLYLDEARFRLFFSRLREAGLARLYQARLPEGRAVASQLVLAGDHPVSHTVAAAADPDFLNLGATPFLRWKAFEALSALGYQANDLTDAALNPVTHFKSQLGGDLRMTTVLARPDNFRLRWIDRTRAWVETAKGAAKHALGRGGD